VSACHPCRECWVRSRHLEKVDGDNLNLGEKPREL
jgi:hypothetical protein